MAVSFGVMSFQCISSVHDHFLWSIDVIDPFFGAMTIYFGYMTSNFGAGDQEFLVGP